MNARTLGARLAHARWIAAGLASVTAPFGAGCTHTSEYASDYPVLLERSEAVARLPADALGAIPAESCARALEGRIAEEQILWCAHVTLPSPEVVPLTELACTEWRADSPETHSRQLLLSEARIAELGLRVGPASVNESPTCHLACYETPENPAGPWRVRCSLGRTLPRDRFLLVRKRSTSSTTWPTIEWNPFVSTRQGRRPRGCAPAMVGLRREASGPPTRAALGLRFAGAAALERASIVAFRELADDLKRLGAPGSLVRGALASSVDERRHARAMSTLARRHGHRAVRVVARRSARSPSLLELAVHNAVEGCVGETFGALLACHQAETSADPVVRRTLAPIARDETRHAALALRVHAWLDGRLTEDQRARVRRAIRDEIQRVRESLPSVESSEAVALGFPAPQVARALVEGLDEVVWRPLVSQRVPSVTSRARSTPAVSSR